MDGQNLLEELLETRPDEIEFLLEDYSRWLEKGGYMDCDWWSEEPKAVLEYLSKNQQIFRIKNKKND